MSVTGKKKIVIIGAGSLQFGLGSVGNILASKTLEGTTICLHDINAGNLQLVHQAAQAAIEKKKVDFNLESTIDRGDALHHADFIINSIEVTPRFELWEHDYYIPLQYGNKQIMGENGGPGGLFHAVRVIPPILDICDDIMRTCPEALFINFSNPMSRICLAIKRKFPKLQFIGLCHEYQHFLPQVARLLDTPIANLETRGGGLNHFGVLLDVKYKDTGKDAYPEIREKGVDFFSTMVGYDGFKLVASILEKFGYLPYTTDSHFGEYIHWAWEKADMPAVRQFYSAYKELLLQQRDQIVSKIQRGKGARLVKPDEENAIPIIEAMLSSDEHLEPSINIPNDGIITNLPSDLVVECPATISKDGIKGIHLGDLPKGIAALLRHQASVQDIAVESILQESKDLLMQALLVDPCVGTTRQAERILEHLLKVEKDSISINFE